MGSDRPLEWSEIVDDAREICEYSSLTPEDASVKVQGFNEVVIQEPGEGAVAAVPLDNGKGKKGKGGLGGNLMVVDDEPEPVYTNQAAPTAPDKPKEGGGNYQQYGGGRGKGPREARFCSLCHLLGRANPKSHNLNDCYANPQNPDHRPDIASMRYDQIKRRNLEMPECMQPLVQKEKQKSGESTQAQDGSAQLDQSLLA